MVMVARMEREFLSQSLIFSNGNGGWCSEFRDRPFCLRRYCRIVIIVTADDYGNAEVDDDDNNNDDNNDDDG